jgi:hypothetical protein
LVRTDPWITDVSYWRPPILTVSAWTEHAPFAYWLMQAVRPASVVELGTHAGYSFFVFCEAVRRLGLDGTKVYALDTWEGDVHAGFYGEEIFESVEATVRERYDEIGRMVRGTFDDARPLFEAGSVDLLHIDGRHRYEDVRHDYETWVSTLSPTGIVVFHDIAERRDDFGVWQFWEELGESHPSFAFEHGHGLGILAPLDVPTGLRPLFDAADEHGDRIRAEYARLGGEVGREWERIVELRELRTQFEELSARVEDLSVRLGTAQQVAESKTLEVESLLEAIEEIRGSTSWKLTRPVRAVGGLLHRS